MTAETSSSIGGIAPPPESGVGKNSAPSIGKSGASMPPIAGPEVTGPRLRGKEDSANSAEMNGEHDHDIEELLGPVDELIKSAKELNRLVNVYGALETSVVFAGFDTLVKRYGADKVIRAMEVRDGSFLRGVTKRVIPDDEERERFYDEVRNESLSDLATTLNEKIGGVYYSQGTLNAMRVDRQAGIGFLRGPVKPVEKLVNLALRPLGGGDRGGNTPHVEALFSGEFEQIIKDNPGLLQRFTQTDDALELLSDIRKLHEAKHTEFSKLLEATSTKLESVVDKRIEKVAKLCKASDEAYDRQVSVLREDIDGADDEEIKAMLQTRLDNMLNEIAATNEAFDAELAAMHSKTIEESGIDELSGLFTLPIRIKPIDMPNEKKPVYTLDSM